MIHRRVLALLSLAALAAVIPLKAGAKAFPSKPIRIIIPYAPGGTTDIVGRRMGQRLSEVLGQPVVVENRAGGNTAIGVDVVAKSAADGHTLLFTNDATFVGNPALYPSLPYNMQRDLVPVAPVTYVALALAINANVPAKDLNELVAYIKTQKSLGYGSFGAGSQPHIMGEMFKKIAGVDLVHVPYKGAGPATADVMGGQILFTFPAFPTIMGQLNSGKLRLLAVSGDKRVPAAPQVPTMTEAGFKDMDMGAWYAFFAPAGTPRDVVMKLNATVASILADRDFVEKNMTNQGMVPMSGTPEQMNTMIKADIERMVQMVKRSGAKVE